MSFVLPSTWFLTLPCWRNVLPQPGYGQTNGFEPSWRNMCCFKLYLEERTWPQIGQWTDFREDCALLLSEWEVVVVGIGILGCCCCCCCWVFESRVGCWCRRWALRDIGVLYVFLHSGQVSFCSEIPQWDGICSRTIFFWRLGLSQMGHL